MTLIDLFFSWPTAIRIVVGAIAFIWLIETLLLPFKINLCVNTLRRIETLLEQLKGRIDVNKDFNADYQKMVKLMQTLLGKDDKE